MGEIIDCDLCRYFFLLKVDYRPLPHASKCVRESEGRYQRIHCLIRTTDHMILAPIIQYFLPVSFDSICPLNELNKKSVRFL